MQNSRRASVRLKEIQKRTPWTVPTSAAIRVLFQQMPEHDEGTDVGVASDPVLTQVPSVLGGGCAIVGGDRALFAPLAHFSKAIRYHGLASLVWAASSHPALLVFAIPVEVDTLRSATWAYLMYVLFTSARHDAPAGEATFVLAAVRTQVRSLCTRSARCCSVFESRERRCAKFLGS